MIAVLIRHTGLCLYLLPEAFILPEGLYVGGALYAADIKPETHELAKTSPPPGLWVGGAWRLTAEGAWEIADPDLWQDHFAAALAAAKAAATERINAAVGAARAALITDIPGQQATYLAKEAEARRVLAGDIGDTPYLTAEAAATGRPVADIARTVAATADNWHALNAGYEAGRQAALQRIAAAATPDEAAAAVLIL